MWYSIHDRDAACLALPSPRRQDRSKARETEQGESFKDFRNRNDERLQNVEAALEQLSNDSAAMKVGGGRSDTLPPDPAYSNALASFIRSGERESEVRAANLTGRYSSIKAAMSGGSPADGGFLAPIEWDRKIIKALTPLSPVRRLATVVQTGVRAWSTLWNLRGWGSGWVGETASGTLASLTFTAGQIYAMPAVTQDLLEDAEIDIGQFIADEIAQEMAKQEGIAFVAGNGVNKPSGLLTYAVGGVNAAAHPGGALDTVTVAGTTAVTVDELIKS